MSVKSAVSSYLIINTPLAPGYQVQGGGGGGEGWYENIVIDNTTALPPLSRRNWPSE